MTTPFLALGIVALIPYVLAVVGGYYRTKQFGKLDNHHPRQQYQQLTGIGARAYAAQQNAWEALAVFSVAVITSQLFAANAEEAATASLLFLATRILHPIFYLSGLAVLRSIVTVFGLGCCIYLFCLAL